MTQSLKFRWYIISEFALLFEKYFLHTMRTFGRALSAVLAARVVHATVPGGLVFKTEDEKVGQLFF